MTLSASYPEKLFYTIGDVTRITGTKPHILRYWESQFKLLRPARRYSGHRKYTQKDIELINRIKYLIIEKRFTLAGAKREINRQFSPKGSAALSESKGVSAVPVLQDIKKEVDACLEILGPADPARQLDLV
jgi:DNA-binding transcriptional MerR regulator